MHTYKLIKVKIVGKLLEDITENYAIATTFYTKPPAEQAQWKTATHLPVACKS